MKQTSFLFVCVLLITAMSFLDPDPPAVRARTEPPDTPVIREPSLAAPANFTADVSHGSIVLSWSKVDGASGYTVRFWHEPFVEWQHLVSTEETSASHTGLTPGETYFYYVCTTNPAGGCESISLTISMAIPPPLEPILSEKQPLPGPVNFIATASSGRVDLKWNAISGTDSYEVWKGDGRGSSVRWGSEAYAITTDAFHTDSDVAAYATYSYVVRAIDGGTEGDWSEVKSVKIPGEVKKPAAAPSVSVAMAGAAAVDVSWRPVAGASGYRVQFWHDGLGDEWSLVPGEQQSPYRHAGLTPGLAYFYIVRAVNIAGVGPWSDWKTDSSRITLPTPPAATTQKGALIALYEAAGGPKWDRNHNWLTDKPLDHWYGVSTDTEGRVTIITLQENRLVGTIPDISALSDLSIINLSGNQLAGKIPNLDALTKLNSLNLMSNQLSGSIPDLSALPDLKFLYLNDNRLNGPIPDLSALSELNVLSLDSNKLSGSIPALHALVNLEELTLDRNRLTEQIPDLSALVHLKKLDTRDNQLTGPVPDLRSLVNLRRLDLGHNRLSGSIPNLKSLDKLQRLHLGNNDLTGPIPDLSALTGLQEILLYHNRLSGPVPELSLLTDLEVLDLNNNRLTGQAPDLRGLARLKFLDLAGNDLCLPPGSNLGGLTAVVTRHLGDLKLRSCTDLDAWKTPAAPQNLRVSTGSGQVDISWDAAPNAATYELWVWDSIDRRWDSIGGALKRTNYTHSVLLDGRNYYYQVRAHGVNDGVGSWSKRVRAIVVAQQFPPPPASFGLEIYFQKHFRIGGVDVVAPSEVSDAKMIGARKIIAGMLSSRPDLLQGMADHNTLIMLKTGGLGGSAGKLVIGGREVFAAEVFATDQNCYVLIHEFAHLVHFVIEERDGGDEFNARLQDTYQNALEAGLWVQVYASKNVLEYWAEIVTYWFQKRVVVYPNISATPLEEYDPEAVKLVSDTFGAASVPPECEGEPPP